MRDLWVFGYGSLMWRPGFDFEESYIGSLEGLSSRTLCLFPCLSRIAGKSRAGDGIE